MALTPPLRPKPSRSVWLQVRQGCAFLSSACAAPFYVYAHRIDETSTSISACLRAPLDRDRAIRGIVTADSTAS